MNKPSTLIKRGYNLLFITKLQLVKDQYFVEFDNGGVISIFKPSEHLYSEKGKKVCISQCSAGDKVYYALFSDNTGKESNGTSQTNNWEKIGNKLYSKLYHLTHISKRKSIEEKGLVPTSKTTGIIQYENRIFLTTTKNKIHEIMDFVGYENVDLWEIDNKELKIKLQSDEFAKMNRCGYTTMSIPAKFLKLKNTF